MRSAVVGGLSILILAAFTGVGVLGAGDKKDKDKDTKDPKHTIKEVMKLAHKDGLLKKVVTGDAGADDKKQLLELYTSLSQNKPPAGDEAAWRKSTLRMVALAKAVADGDEKAAKQLAKTVNCKSCHKMFKG